MVSVPVDEFLQAPDALRKAVLAGGEAPAQEAFALRTEGDAGGQAKPGFGDQAFAEIEAVVHAIKPEKGVHRAGGQWRFDASDLAQLRTKEVARRVKAQLGASDHGFAVFNGGKAGALDRRIRRTVNGSDVTEYGYDRHDLRHASDKRSCLPQRRLHGLA